MVPHKKPAPKGWFLILLVIRFSFIKDHHGDVDRFRNGKGAGMQKPQSETTAV